MPNPFTNHHTIMFDQTIANSQPKSVFSHSKSPVATVSKIAKRSPSGKEVFVCPEESNFYSQCLDAMVLCHTERNEVVIEFGSGDGLPIINSLLKVQFDGLIHGYELNKTACEIANAKIASYELDDKYVIHNSCFFSSVKPDARYLVSNPPYIPSIDSDIYMPLLRGGTDGSTITRRLLSLDYENVLLMVSSYSNPVDTIDYALDRGYLVSKFLVSPLQFGYYSSEPKVRQTIAKLKEINKAFYSDSIYLLAGVLFQKQHNSYVDLSAELRQIMTSL